MYIHALDPHIGRCENLRHDKGDPYRVKMKRCLELEGHTGPCRFNPDSPPPEQWSSSFHNTAPIKPERWVPPPVLTGGAVSDQEKPQ